MGEVIRFPLEEREVEGVCCGMGIVRFANEGCGLKTCCLCPSWLPFWEWKEVDRWINRQPPYDWKKEGDFVSGGTV